METTINVSGMSCGHCVTAVRKAVEGVPGVVVRDVTIGTVVLDLGSATDAMSAVEAAIEDAGYAVVTGRALNILPADARESTSGA